MLDGGAIPRTSLVAGPDHVRQAEDGCVDPRAATGACFHRDVGELLAQHPHYLVVALGVLHRPRPSMIITGSAAVADRSVHVPFQVTDP